MRQNGLVAIVVVTSPLHSLRGPLVPITRTGTLQPRGEQLYESHTRNVFYLARVHFPLPSPASAAANACPM